MIENVINIKKCLPELHRKLLYNRQNNTNSKKKKFVIIRKENEIWLDQKIMKL